MFHGKYSKPNGEFSMLKMLMLIACQISTLLSQCTKCITLHIFISIQTDGAFEILVYMYIIFVLIWWCLYVCDLKSSTSEVLFVVDNDRHLEIQTLTLSEQAMRNGSPVLWCDWSFSNNVDVGDDDVDDLPSSSDVWPTCLGTGRTTWEEPGPDSRQPCRTLCWIGCSAE